MIAALYHTGQFAAGGKRAVRSFSALIAPKTDAELDALAGRARELTLSAFWPHHAAICAALSFQRVHQQLSLLRILPRKSNSARHAFGR